MKPHILTPLNDFEPERLMTSQSLKDGLADRARPVNLDVVRRVAAMYRALKKDQVAVPEVYQPGGEWRVYIEQRPRLYTALRDDRIEEAAEVLASFWRNELGPIVKEYARYEQLTAREEPFTERFQYMLTRNFLVWKEMIRQPVSSLDIPLIGNPWGLLLENQLVVPCSLRHHVLATHMGNLTSDRKRPVVAEIGAGYGGMAYYLLRDRPTSVFVDLDLPETLVLAAFFLLSALPDRSFWLYGESPSLPEDFSRYSAVLMPNYAMPHLSSDCVDVVLNTYSMTEMPRPTIEEYLRQVTRMTREYFVHHNIDRAGVVNRGFERTPASTFPIDSTKLKLINKGFDLFHGHYGDYREFIYARHRAL